MTFKEGDLVMLRLPNTPAKGRQRHYNTWFRVAFIDNNGTFIGIVERIERDFDFYKIGEHISIVCEQVQRVYKNGDQFCYSDGVTVCNCSTLCRNK